MDPADLRALNETFATIERAINSLNARLSATMAFVAAIPGASHVDIAEVERQLAMVRLDPVLTSAVRAPGEFVHEALLELRRLSLEAKDALRPAPTIASAEEMRRRVNGV